MALKLTTAVTRFILNDCRLLVISEKKGQAAFYIAHKVGSVQDEDNLSSLIHFLEHMAFNGSKHFPSGDVFGFILRLGNKT